MFTEAIKRWLRNLFAWWPWKLSPASYYAGTSSTLNKSTTQESLLRTAVDGPIPQQGATSVVVEHAETRPPSEMSRPANEERSERIVSPPPHPPQGSQPSPTSEERADISRPTPVEAAKERAGAAEAVSSPTPEQKLEFLRYLVKRGIVNEGFTAGQVPEQYNKGK
jgi:hypothetical protein